MNVATFRTYRIRDIVTTEFFSVSSQLNREFADEDLERSGLTLDDLQAAAPEMLRLPEGALAGYHIPYFGLDGKVLTGADNVSTMYRVRLKHHEFSKAPRYTQPSREQLARDGLPSFLPYLYPCSDLGGDTIYCCEGEKKTASLVRHLRVPAFGIAGCNMWGNPAGTGGVHPWILEYLAARTIKKVVIIPDADVFRYDICTAYGTFAHALMQSGFEVALLNPPDKIDDLIVQWTAVDPDRAIENLHAIKPLTPDELVQTPAQLATTYDLAFKRTKDDKVIVHQNTSNIMRLLENHPAFPKIWRNTDTNRVIIGDDQAVPDLTEMKLANHIQHNFGLEKVTDATVYKCIQALSKQNQRSPMLEYVQSLEWDQKPRLDTWLTDTWGAEDTPYTREVASKWMLSACARMAVPGSKVDWIFIVVGPQGTGKTSMPGIVFKGNSLTLYGEHNDKDLHLLLHSALVVGFDELDSFSRKDASLLKAMITRTEDAFRPPYGASVEIFPRRFTLYGCGNRHEFLQNDPSGQRRYAIVPVERLLDFARLEAIRDDLWAEAWTRYSSGRERWWEVSGASDEAKKYEIPNILAEQIDNWIQAQLMSKHGAMVVDGQLRFSMSQLMAGIGESNNVGSPKVREAAGILRGLGYEQKVVKQGGRAVRLYIAK